jgi:drug/metabolite transporter (DMT)-like permease
VSLAIGLALAAVSALATNVGFLLRHRGAVAAPDVDVRRPLKSVAGLFRQKWWTVGYLIAALAYALHVAALSLAALSLVQAVLAGGLVILGVLGERFFGFRLGRRQWAGVGLTAAGLAFLAGTGDSSSGQESAEFSATAMIAFESSLVGVGTALIVSCRADRARDQLGLLLGLAAGLLFTMTHVAVKALSGTLDRGWAELVLSPYLLIAVLGGVAAFFASARSLQIGPAVPVIAITSIASNASAIPAGVIVFGDPLGADAATVAMRSLAFLLVVGAAALIPAPTRAAGVEHEPTKRDPAPAPA